MEFTGTQISIFLLSISLLIIIYWVRATNKAINKYNQNQEKEFRKEFNKKIPGLKKKGFSEEQIENMYIKLKQKIEYDNLTPEEKSLNDLSKDPMGFLKNRFS